MLILNIFKKNLSTAWSAFTYPQGYCTPIWMQSSCNPNPRSAATMNHYNAQGFQKKN